MMKGFRVYLAGVLKAQDILLFAGLFMLFFAYRSFFWEDFSYHRYQILINSFFDMAIILINTVVIRLLLRRKPSGNVRVAFGGAVAGMVVLSSLLLKELHHFGHSITTGFTSVFQQTFEKLSFQMFDTYTVVCVGTMISLIVTLYNERNRARHRNEELEKEKALAELNYLRSQLNPHFMFNTLNSVYFLIDQKNEEARKSLSSFCELLRYQLYQTATDEIEIEREIDLLQNYISLQKLRFSENYQINMQVAHDLKGFRIAPMLLITMVENAFKHISHNREKPNKISVNLNKTDNVFACRVANTSNRSTQTLQGGIGLQNLTRRLELLYNGRSDLRISSGPEEFEINLSLKI